ncbi:MAG: penicillin-binding protein activator [Thiomargarita sp.]|nr:penicillin-binding protein activator [Thiomargarita sp.]
MSLTRFLIIYLLSFFILSGCIPFISGQTNFGDTMEMQTANTVNTVRQLEIQGNYHAAAQKYLQIVVETNNPIAQQSYQLSAIEAFFKANMPNEAKTEFSKINAPQSFYSLGNLKAKYQFLQAKMALVDGNLVQAKNYFNTIDFAKLMSPNLKIKYKQIQAQIFLAENKLLKAINEWNIADKLAGTDTFLIRENHRNLWRNLSLQPVAELETITTTDKTIRGWISLALLNKVVSIKHLPTSINHWKLRFSNHVAKKYIVPEFIANIPVSLNKPQQIALLLPLTGKYGDRSRIIQNGFFIVSEMNENTNFIPTIKIFDTNSDNILQEYQKAVEADVDFIVGPLEKEAIQVLVKNTKQLPVPTLVLNHLKTDVDVGNLYQFALSPEDEIKIIVERAWMDGHRTAVAFVPDANWGNDVLNTFITAWKAKGGKIISQYSYDAEFEKNIPINLRKIKNVEAVDMIFMLAFPSAAIKIRPLFKYKWKNIPIYSTSHIYAGVIDTKRDAKLTGIRFADMPWILKLAGEAKKWQRSLKNSWSDEMKKYKRLFAFGIDAYNLLSFLKELNEYNWQGQTGSLVIDDKGLIHRNQLYWAEFIQGEAQLLE